MNTTEKKTPAAVTHLLSQPKVARQMAAPRATAVESEVTTVRAEAAASGGGAAVAGRFLILKRRPAHSIARARGPGLCISSFMDFSRSLLDFDSVL